MNQNSGRVHNVKILGQTSNYWADKEKSRNHSNENTYETVETRQVSPKDDGHKICKLFESKFTRFTETSKMMNEKMEAYDINISYIGEDLNKFGIGGWANTH